MKSQYCIALDLEGVLIPEIWQLIAHHTNIKDLTLTTRDIADYNELMTLRLRAIHQHGITIDDIQSVIHTLDPLEGALDFFLTLRKHAEVIIISDTFVEFFQPIRKKLMYPTIFCNHLIINEKSRDIEGYSLRLQDGKTHTVQALKTINCTIASVGDSYNDVGMLYASDYGYFFSPPDSIKTQHPTIPCFYNYTDLCDMLLSHTL